MEANIKQINNAIAEKGERLKEKTKRNFSMITIPQNENRQNNGFENKKINIPPISIILYAAALVSFICIFAADATVFFIIATIVCAYFGFRLSNSNKPEKRESKIDTMQLKSDISSKIVESVKSISSEWDDFIELKQKELQSQIMSSSMPEEKKDQLLSKIYIHEIIDISLSDLSQMMNGISTTADFCSELQRVKDCYLNKLLSAIDTTARKQIERYNSLIK